MTQTLNARLGRHGRTSDAEEQQFDIAKRLLPGGALGGNALPEDAKFVFSHGAGGRFWDTSGNEYIDYCLGSGSLFLGHAHPAIVRAVTEQAVKGMHFFAYLNEASLRLAEIFCKLVPCAERVRFTTSGSDSTFRSSTRRLTDSGCPSWPPRSTTSRERRLARTSGAGRSTSCSAATRGARRSSWGQARRSRIACSIRLRTSSDRSTARCR